MTRFGTGRATLLANQVSSENLSILDQALTKLRQRNQTLSDEAESVEKELAKSRGIVVDPHKLVASLTQKLGRFRKLFDVGTIEKQRLFIRQMLNRVKIDPVRKKGQAFWYRLEEVALGRHEDHLLRSIGATRFELATSWSQTTRSNQAELRPESFVLHYIPQPYRGQPADHLQADSNPLPFVSDLITRVIKKGRPEAVRSFRYFSRLSSIIRTGLVPVL